jgi:signal transduction histidine kinase
VLLTFSGDPRPVVASSFHVEHVLRNLMSNAEKYSPSSAPIEVQVERDELEVRVTVLDRGAGIPDEEQQHIFDPFYRSPRTSDHARGMGIGLAVCKRLIEAQGGRIWVASREGGGTVFGFGLPVVAEDQIDSVEVSSAAF